MNRFIIFFVFIPMLLFPQDKNESILDDANKQYILGNFEDAFSLINIYMKSKEGAPVSERAVLIGEKIYYFYIQSLLVEKRFSDITLVEKVMRSNKLLFSDRVLELLNNNNESSKKIRSNNYNEIDDKLEQLLKNTDNLTQDELIILLRESLSGEKSKVIEYYEFTFIALGLLFTLIIIFIVIFKRRGRRVLSPIIKFSSDVDSVLRGFLSNAIEIGEKVDQITNRKNNSFNTAELIYKVSIKSGVSDKKSLIYYIIGLIYDIGLLKVDSSLLKKSKIDNDEFEEIKKHVYLGLEMVSFVPDQYKDLVKDAIKNHHENLDGSGYPQGSTHIEFLPRLIRVIEAFLSQISTREYNLIRDKEVAIKNLRKDIDKYDQEIVELLYQVI